MSRFFGYSHYYVLQAQRRQDDAVRPPPEGFSLLGRTLLVLGTLALASAVAAGLVLAS